MRGGGATTCSTRALVEVEWRIPPEKEPQADLFGVWLSLVHLAKKTLNHVVKGINSKVHRRGFEQPGGTTSAFIQVSISVVTTALGLRLAPVSR